jgi:hypothetical protein
MNIYRRYGFRHIKKCGDSEALPYDELLTAENLPTKQYIDSITEDGFSVKCPNGKRKRGVDCGEDGYTMRLCLEPNLVAANAQQVVENVIQPLQVQPQTSSCSIL